MTPEEYNQAVHSHSDGLYRFMLKFCDADSARDIVQDCFEKLWIKRESVDASKVKSYLFTAAHHTMIDLKRKNKRMDFTDQVSISQDFYQLTNPDVQEHLHNALNTLPDIQKTIILLRDYEGYSYQEIGEITGLNESQVKVYIFRARVNLKNYIGSLSTII